MEVLDMESAATNPREKVPLTFRSPKRSAEKRKISYSHKAWREPSPRSHRPALCANPAIVARGEGIVSSGFRFLCLFGERLFDPFQRPIDADQNDAV